MAWCQRRDVEQAVVGLCGLAHVEAVESPCNSDFCRWIWRWVRDIMGRCLVVSLGGRTSRVARTSYKSTY